MLKELTINATPGACIAPANEINSTLQNVASGKKLVASVIAKVAINPNINETANFTITYDLTEIGVIFKDINTKSSLSSSNVNAINAPKT